MSDRMNPMLEETETLAMLHAGRTGTEPPLIDLTPIALRGGLRMRRRRQVAQVGSGLVLAGVASLALVVATPGLNTGGRADIVPAGTAADPDTMSEAELHSANLGVLADALGPDFRVLRAETPDGSEYLAPAPGSPAAKALPAGYVAQADVIVATGEDGWTCKPDPDREGTTTACETRFAADGRKVELEIRSGDLAPSTPVETRRIQLTQPDGDSLTVSLWVKPASVPSGNGRVPRNAILDWLAPYSGALVEAVTDARMAPGSIARRAKAGGAAYIGSTPRERNLTVLHYALGSSFDRAGGLIQLRPGSDASAGLPAGLGAQAGMSSGGGTNGAPECTAPRCTTREIPGGTAYVYISGPRPDQPWWPGIFVQFIRSDGDRYSASLDLTEEFTGDASEADQILAWLNSFEDELIAAVTDPKLEVEPEER